MAVVVVPFLYVGTLISKNFAALLEEHDIFVPEDDDDDDWASSRNNPKRWNSIYPLVLAVNTFFLDFLSIYSCTCILRKVQDVKFVASFCWSLMFLCFFYPQGALQYGLKAYQPVKERRERLGNMTSMCIQTQLLPLSFAIYVYTDSIFFKYKYHVGL